MTIADIHRMKGNCRGLGQNVDLKIYLSRTVEIFLNQNMHSYFQNKLTNLDTF